MSEDAGIDDEIISKAAYGGEFLKLEQASSLAAPVGSKSGLFITCVRCGIQLGQQGALLFGPPDEWQQVEKIHLCGCCWDVVKSRLRS